MRSRQRATAICSITLGFVMFAGVTCTPPQAQAGPQFDAHHYAHQKRNAAAWKAEDALIDEKLAALRQRFGKRPNIIYILADDVGWGEMAPAGHFLLYPPA